MARKSLIKFHHINSFFGNEPKLVEKGENAVESGHVRKLNYDGTKHIIKATIDASMKDKSYELEITFKADGSIDKNYCACPRGMDKCHHLAAALIYAHHNVSITDSTCQWNFKKQSKNSGEIKTVDEIFKAKDFTVTTSVPHEEIRQEVLKMIVDNNGVVGFRWILADEPSPSILKHQSMEEILFSLKTGSREELMNSSKLTDQDIVEVEVETRGQSLNWKWAKYRKFRLTASNFGKIIGAIRRNSFPPSLFTCLSGNYDLKNLKQVQWGIQNEKNGVTQFEKSLNATVQQTGLWLHQSGLLGASPDGVIYHKDGTLSILEVKCPYKYRLDDLKSKLKDIKNYILKVEDGRYVLNKTHDYYHQIQGQLAITKAKCCFLIVWTVKSTVIYEVKPDKEWQHINSLIGFFVEKWAPWVIKTVC